MPLAVASESVLIVVDLQEKFLAPIVNSDVVVRRCKFMIEVANLLDVPVLATVQNSERMGGVISEIADLVPEADDKMRFSCCGSEEFMSNFRAHRRGQAVIVGIETHICVNQTAHDLMRTGSEVFVVADACAARGTGHEIGLPRLRQAGITIAHSESIVYEWLGTASHSKFREVLQIVKAPA